MEKIQFSNGQKEDSQGPNYAHNIKEIQARTLLLSKLRNKKLKTTTKLYTIAIMCIIFMTLELVGGIISHSLAIMSDAAHILSDFCGLMISIISIHISFKPANQLMTYGYHRAEIIGALGSVLLIWGLSAWLFVEAVNRVLNPKKIDPLIMLITAIIGLIINITMAKVLHGGLDGHSQGHLHGHSHGHSHVRHNHHQQLQEEEEVEDEDEDEEDLESIKPRYMSSLNQFIIQKQQLEDNIINQSKKIPLLQSQDYQQKLQQNEIKLKIQQDTNQTKPKNKKKGQMNAVKTNVNVRAAFIHIIGDIIQSIGVIIAAIIIMIDNDLVIADPITTFLCSILVFLFTLPIFKQSILILMQGTPDSINVLNLYRDLNSVIYNIIINIFQFESQIEQVLSLHDIHIWSISQGKMAMTCHLQSDNPFIALSKATKICQNKYKILHTTIQVQGGAASSHHKNHFIDCRQDIHE